MLFTNQNEKTTCTNCGLTVKKLNLSRHNRSCTKRTNLCLKFPNFFCKTQGELNHHLTTNVAMSVLEVKIKRLTRGKDCPSFYFLRKHKKCELSKLSRIQDLSVDLERFMGDYVDQELAKSSQLVSIFWLILNSSEVDSAFSILHLLMLFPVS